MKDQSKNIDTLLQEELGNITELPPPSVWVSLEARLDKGAPMHKHKRLWKFWPLALAVLVSSTVIGYRNWPAPKTPAPAEILQAPAQDDNNNNPPLPGTINNIPDNNTRDTLKQQEKINKPAANGTNPGSGHTQNSETQDPAAKEDKSGYTPGTKSKTAKGANTANSGEEYAPGTQHQKATANTRSNNNNKTDRTVADKNAIAGVDKPGKTTGAKQKAQADAGNTRKTTANSGEENASRAQQQKATANTPNKNNNKTEETFAGKAATAGIDKPGNTPGAKQKVQADAGNILKTTANSGEENASRAQQQKATANTRNNNNNKTEETFAGKAATAGIDKPGNKTGAKQKAQADAGNTLKTTANSGEENASRAQQQKATANTRNNNNNKTEETFASKAATAGIDKPGNTPGAKQKAQADAGNTRKTTANSGEENASRAQQQKATANTRNNNNNKTEETFAGKAATAGIDKPGNTTGAKQKAQADAGNTRKTTANSGEENAPGTKQQKGTEKEAGNKKTNEDLAAKAAVKAMHKAENKSTEPGLKAPQAATATKPTANIKDQGETTSTKLLTPPAEAGEKTAPAKRTADAPPSTQKKAAIPEEEEENENDPPVPEAKAPKPASKIRITDENGKNVLPAATTEPNKTTAKAPLPKEDYLKQRASGESDGGGEAAPKTASKEKHSTPGRFEGGVKVGYETGAETYTARKLTFAAYLQYNITPRLGLIFQPAIKSAQTNQGNARAAGSYYQVTSMQDSLYQMKDSIFSFAYRQTFDSFVARTTVERKYIELDLPVMLKYQLDKHIALSAGLNLSLGKIINLNSELETYKGLELRDTIHTDKGIAPAPRSKFSHPGSVPFSTYVPPVNSADVPIRIGYTLGVTYTFRERFLVDFMVQKTTSNLNKIPDNEIRKIYSQHYFKVMFGYKLFAPKKKVRDMP